MVCDVDGNVHLSSGKETTGGNLMKSLSVKNSENPEIRADKSLGQHFLFDQGILTEIVNFAGASSNDVILEIGPGLGSLTAEILRTGAKILAVEYDKNLAENLPLNIQKFIGGGDDLLQNLEIINADFLQFDLNQVPQNYKVVANIPYYITAKIVKKLLTADNKPKTITLLIQKEVAERLAAGDGDLSILAISAQVYSRVTLGPIVQREFFNPAPKVHSQVVKMELYDKNLISDINEKEFFRLVKIGFSSPRKKVLRNLSGGLQESPDKIREIFTKLDIPENARAENLTIDDWKNIHNDVM